MPDSRLSELADAFDGQPIALVSCLSFEERSLTVANRLASGGLRRWVCLVNEDIETDIADMRAKALEIGASAGIEVEFLPASKRDPLRLADTLVELAGNQSADGGIRWVADITTMTHEMVLMTVAAAEEIIAGWSDMTVVYNVAGQYSGSDAPKDKWVSRGIHEVRSVIGYPGSWSPGEQTTLIAIPGFDPERMHRIVEEIEPDRLIVGIACPVGEHHSWSEEKNRRIAAQLLSTRKGTTFDFPALDPMGAVKAIIDATADVRNNVLLAPLNSKISTLALGVLARCRPEWQVCYAPALIYNVSYATASDSVIMCSLADLRTEIARLLPAVHA
jgi:hypothetical protein